MSERVEYAAGMMCASITLYTLGNQARGITAAPISFLTAKSVIQKSRLTFELEKLELKHKIFLIVTDALAKISGGFIFNNGIALLCPRSPIKRACAVVVFGLAIEEDEFPPLANINHIIITGLILIAIPALRNKGYIK